MSGHHDLHLDLCAALALGSIEPADRRVLEEHLAGGCAECHALLRDLSVPVEALARSVDPVVPTRGLKARTMVAVAQVRREGPGPAAGGRSTAAPAPRVATWGWAAAAVLLVAAGAGWWRAATLGERVDELANQAADAEPDAQAQWEAFLRERPGVRVIELAANEHGEPGRVARVAYDAAARTALARFENFKAPAGKDFELWTVRDGKPVSEGLVRVNRQGQGVRRIENTGDPVALAAFAVSNESLGGSKDRQTPAAVAYVGGVPK